MVTSPKEGIILEWDEEFQRNKNTNRRYTWVPCTQSRIDNPYRFPQWCDSDAEDSSGDTEWNSSLRSSLVWSNLLNIKLHMAHCRFLFWLPSWIKKPRNVNMMKIHYVFLYKKNLISIFLIKTDSFAISLMVWWWDTSIMTMFVSLLFHQKIDKISYIFLFYYVQDIIKIRQQA